MIFNLYFLNFRYVEKALAKLDLCNGVIPEDELKHAADECAATWRQVIAFFSLRLMLAPVIESLLLCDRMLYLYEQGILWGLLDSQHWFIITFCSCSQLLGLKNTYFKYVLVTDLCSLCIMVLLDGTLSYYTCDNLADINDAYLKRLFKKKISFSKKIFFI